MSARIMSIAPLTLSPRPPWATAVPGTPTHTVFFTANANANATGGRTCVCGTVYRRIKGIGGCSAGPGGFATTSCAFTNSDIATTPFYSLSPCNHCHDTGANLANPRAVPIIFRQETDPQALRVLAATHPGVPGLKRAVRRMLRNLYLGVEAPAQGAQAPTRPWVRSSR